MFRGLAALALVAVVVAGGKGCAPEQPDGNTKSKQAVAPAAPSVDPNKGTVKIYHKVGLEEGQRLAVPRKAPAKSWERQVADGGTNATRKIDLVVTRDFEGFLSCTIWYIEGGKAWVLAYDESSKGGGVACSNNANSFKLKMKQNPQDISKCNCTVGNKTFVLRIIWT